MVITLFTFLSNLKVSFFFYTVVQIPIIGKISADSPKEIVFAARLAKSKHIIIVNESASEVVSLLKRLLRERGSSTTSTSDEDTEQPSTSVLLRSILRRCKNEEDKLDVQAFFRKSYEVSLINVNLVCALRE